MGYTDSTELTLRALRANGVQLAVDNFGTSHSSLISLRRLAIDTLKIDRTFVRRLTTAPQENKVVAAAIGIGRTLDLRVVAEGVETFDEAAFLWAHGCDEALGHYFGRPGPPEELARLLKEGLSALVLPHHGTHLPVAQADSRALPHPSST